MYSAQPASSLHNAALSTLSLSPQHSTFEELFFAQPVEKLAAGSGLFWEGDAASHLFRIEEGCLRLYRILTDGRRAIMGFRFAGEAVGVSSQDRYDCTAEAVTPVRLRRLSHSRLRVMEEVASGLRPLFMAKVFEEMRAAQKHIIVLGQLGAEERVANFLMTAALRTGADQKRPVVIDLPMTRLDIADYLGLTIETVCRAMSKLKRDGFITLQGRHKVMLRHMSDLQELAGMVDDPGEASFQFVPARRAN